MAEETVFAQSEVCLQSQRDKLYRGGFRGRVSRSTLADANANRSFLIYQDFGLHLIARARRLYQHEPFALNLKHAVLTLDSTTIDLCLSVFPWAHFRTTKAAVKAHTLLDLCGSIPTFVALTSAKVHDVLALDWISLQMVRDPRVSDRCFRSFLPSRVLCAQVRHRHHRLYSDIASYRTHLCHF